MRFLGLAPAQSWALLAAVAAAVVLLYLLKPSPRRMAVASAQIWQRVLKARKRKPERLRWWLSLLLALAIGLSLALALTQPELAAVSGKAEDLVLVVDNAPSMGARTADNRTRLALAVEQAGRLIDGAGAGSRFLVLDSMHTLGVPAFETKSAARARLERIAVTHSGRPWIPELAAAADGDNARRVVLISDGVAQIDAPAQAQRVSVFRPADNVGIVAFDVRAAPNDARRYDAFLQVLNASPGIKRAQVRIVGVGAPPIKRDVQLEAGAGANLTIDVSGFGEGPLKAVVSAEQDALALDDEAFAYLPSKGRVRIGVVTGGNPALLQSLRMLPRVEVENIALARAGEAGRYDALVYDRVAPEQVPAVPALLIAPPARGWLPKSAGEVSETHVAAWDSAHPLIGGVSLRDVLIERAQSRKAGEAAGFDTLARGPKEEPLILAAREGRRLALVGFALGESNFARQESFPAFLSNAVVWLTREPQAQRRALGSVGVPANARVLDFEGREVAVRPVSGALAFDASAPGLYTAVTRDQRIRIAANLFDPAVTRINAASVAPAQSPAGVPSARTATDPWLLLLALAALLLGVEWVTYHRKVTL